MNTYLYLYICTFTCIPCDVLRCIGRLDFERRRWALSRTEVHTPKVSYECLFRCIWRILKRLQTYLELKFLRPAEVPTRPLDEYPAARIDVIGRAPSSAPVPAASTHIHTSSVCETHHHVASAFMSAYFFSSLKMLGGFRNTDRARRCQGARYPCVLRCQDVPCPCVQPVYSRWRLLAWELRYRMPTGSCCTEPEFGRFTRHQCNRDYQPPCTT